MDCKERKMNCKERKAQICLIGSLCIFLTLLVSSHNQEIPMAAFSQQANDHLKTRKTLLDKMCQLYQNPFRPEANSLHHRGHLAHLSSFQYFLSE